LAFLRFNHHLGEHFFIGHIPFQEYKNNGVYKKPLILM